MTTFNRIEYQEKLDNLWDRLSELAGGNLWNRLSKEEWKLAKEIFDLEEGALAGIPEEKEKLEPCLWDTCVCWDEEEHRLRNK